jgi:hypothetical protein
MRNQGEKKTKDRHPNSKEEERNQLALEVHRLDM